MTVRRTIVRQYAAPGITAARDVYVGCPVDVVRVAALVEIAAAAATLARTIVRLRHLDPATITAYVADPVDARAVLGRGRWLPTMTGHVLQPPASGQRPALAASAASVSVRRRNLRRAGTGTVGQLPLFPTTVLAASGGGR